MTFSEWTKCKREVFLLIMLFSYSPSSNIYSLIWQDRHTCYRHKGDFVQIAMGQYRTLFSINCSYKIIIKSNMFSQHIEVLNVNIHLWSAWAILSYCIKHDKNCCSLCKTHSSTYELWRMKKEVMKITIFLSEWERITHFIYQWDNTSCLKFVFSCGV